MMKAYRKEDFDCLIDKVVKVDHRIKYYLYHDGYEKMSRVHAPINRDRMMTFNITEYINDCLVKVWELSILEFLKESRILLDHETAKTKK